MSFLFHTGPRSCQHTFLKCVSNWSIKRVNKLMKQDKNVWMNDNKRL